MLCRSRTLAMSHNAVPKRTFLDEIVGILSAFTGITPEVACDRVYLVIANTLFRNFVLSGGTEPGESDLGESEPGKFI